MADTIVATYGAAGFDTPAFTYCGFRAASGSGADPPSNFDHIRVWINNCDEHSSGYQDVAHVTVVAHSDAGPSTDQYVWVAFPGGTHITHYGDDDGGSGDLSIPYFDPSGYYDISIGSRADLFYCFTVTWDYCSDLPLWPIPSSDDWHVGGPHWA